MHVNVNCSDYERSRKFYELLGFKVMWEVSQRNPPEIAAAVGMPPYLVRGALQQLEESPTTTLIDLLEWKEPPTTLSCRIHICITRESLGSRYSPAI